jgi:alpha-beta hydrolase superfamily lysophospholipase
VRSLPGWIRRRWQRILLATLAILIVFFALVVPYLLAVLITSAGTRPMDLGLTSSPADYGLDYEEVSFRSTDGVALSGWLLGGGSREVTVICGHGLFRSRREVLDRAAFFREQGFEAILFDFRRHGKSGGERVTLGYEERFDFEGAIDFARERNPRARIVLYGVSMGAGAALLAARDRAEVEAVIADSPFLNIEHTVAHHVKLIFGLPRFPFASALLLFLEWRGGFDRADFDLAAAVTDLGKRPVLIIAGGEDARMPPDLQKRLYEASRSRASRFLLVPEAAHGAAYRVAPESYERAVLDFLEAAGLSAGGR